MTTMKRFMLSLFGILFTCILGVQAQETTIELPTLEGPVMVPRLKKIIVPAKRNPAFYTEPNAKAEKIFREEPAFVVMEELGGWYKVAITEIKKSETAEDIIDVAFLYAAKKDFKVARLQPVTESVLRQTGYEVSIRKSGRHKGLCILWSRKALVADNSMEFRIGRINNEGIACFRTNDWYSLDEENERVFIRCWFDQAEVEFQLGKSCTRRNSEGGFEADFNKLTDEDLDHMLPALEGTNVYESAYAAIDKQDSFFFMYLPLYGTMGNYWDNRYSIDEAGPAYELVPLK